MSEAHCTNCFKYRFHYYLDTTRPTDHETSVTGKDCYTQRSQEKGQLHHREPRGKSQGQSEGRGSEGNLGKSLCWVSSFYMSLTRTFFIEFRAYPDNPGWSLHLKIVKLMKSAKTLL